MSLVRQHTVITAGQLCVEHIDTDIRFRIQEDDRQISYVIDAELRQINHNGGHTTIHVGVGAEVEYTVEHDLPVVLNPPEDYHDYRELKGEA